MSFKYYRQQALNQLNQAELLNPAFDNEFMIYRYKKIIEEELNISQKDNSNNMEVLTETSF